jgi:hypothetical protein
MKLWLADLARAILSAWVRRAGPNTREYLTYAGLDVDYLSWRSDEDAGADVILHPALRAREGRLRAHDGAN